MADPTNKLNVYLIKSGVTDEQIVRPGLLSSNIDGVGTFFGVDSQPITPNWFSSFFGAAIASPFRLLSANSKGVLLVKRTYEEERTFAITFGHGRFLLADGVVEERFGLKIVLNTMEDDSFRSFDRTTLGSSPRQSREQVSRGSDVSAFGLDIEQDLVRSVTAKSRDRRLGKIITGRDSLSISAKFGAHNIGTLLDICMSQYASQSYKENYDWIDQISHVKDPAKLNELNNDLVERLNKSNYENIWMAPPDILDWVDIKDFRYGSSKKSKTTEDLDISEFMESLGDDPITLESINSKAIIAVSSKDDSVAEQWNAFRCIYAETTLDKRVHVLNDGKWYEIAADFSDRVNIDYLSIPTADLKLPPYAHKDENAYNEFITTQIEGACCMDQKLIQHGGGKSKIEFCDVATKDGKLIHVKRRSGSAQLSHLFSQGAVAGELYVQDSNFREKLNDKFPDTHKLGNPAQQPDPKAHEIVFAVVGGNGSENIPFFSKVTIRNARRRLRGYGYNVSKCFVPAENPEEGEADDS